MFPTSFTPPIQPQQGGKMPSVSNPFPSMSGGAPMTDKERMFLGALEGAMQGGNIHQQDGWAIYGGGKPMGAAMGIKKVYGDIDAEKRAEKKRKQERTERMEEWDRRFEKEAAARKADRVLGNYQKQLDRDALMSRFGQTHSLAEERARMENERDIANRLTKDIELGERYDIEREKLRVARDELEAKRQAAASKKVEDALKVNAPENRAIEGELKGLEEGGQKLRNMLGDLQKAGRQAEAVADIKPLPAIKPKATKPPMDVDLEVWMDNEELDANKKVIVREMLKRDPNLTRQQILNRLFPEEAQAAPSGDGKNLGTDYFTNP